jgi:UDP-N-acetyl-D-glucosamine dehydrogenase
VIAEAVAAGQFRATADFAWLADAEAILICVPTPLTAHREPDMSFIVQTAEAVAPAPAGRATRQSGIHNLSWND